MVEFALLFENCKKNERIYVFHFSMRARIIFWLNNRGEVLPFNHQFMIEVFLRSILQDHFGEKPSYTFSGLKGQSRISTGGLGYWSSKVTIVVASQNKELVEFLIHTIFKTEIHYLGTLSLTPESVAEELIPEFGIDNKYICLSPITLLSPEINDQEIKRFVEPSSDLFSDILYESTMLRMQASGKYTSEQLQEFYKFQIKPDEVYLKKMKSENKKVARVYFLDGSTSSEMEIRGYTFPFTLYADSEVQNFVFYNGLGEYCRMGYGLLDTADSQFQNRTIPYPATSQIQISSTFKPREKVV
jgi:CRISPR-associated endoribonuclease Cas6